MPGEATRQNALLDVLTPNVCLTMDEIFERSALTRRQIAKGAGDLISRGYIERVETGCYQLTPEGAAAKAAGVKITSGPFKPLTAARPRKDSYTARLWRAMRAARTFTVPELMTYAARAEKNGRASADYFVRALYLTGYIAALPRRRPGTAPSSNGFKQYLLIRDTGYLPPIVRRPQRCVYDQNLCETFGFEGARP